MKIYLSFMPSWALSPRLGAAHTPDYLRGNLHRIDEVLSVATLSRMGLCIVELLIYWLSATS